MPNEIILNITVRPRWWVRPVVFCAVALAVVAVDIANWIIDKALDHGLVVNAR
jgi:hypothetical protein